MNHIERIKKAQEYVKANRANVNSRYRHQIHLQPEIGWLNDPNGFSWFNGLYHLFYQYYPYSNQPGLMYWAHVVSKDLISWSDMTIALAPGESYDKNGVFSGTAIEVDNKLWVYYTGHIETKLDRIFDEQMLRIPDNGDVNLELRLLSDTNTELKYQDNTKREVQCLAISEDGKTFNKYESNPIIGTREIPIGASIEDFRDPKVFKHGEQFYMLLGSTTTEKVGKVLFYKSEDGINWVYVNELCLGPEYGSVCECPDLFNLHGVDVLIISPQNVYRHGLQFENIHASIALIGEFDYDTCEFQVSHIQEIDGGFDFYAPQTIEDREGRRIMIGWMHMWETEYLLDVNNHGWNGAMSFPRALSYKAGQLYQLPVEEINHYYSDQQIVNNILLKENKSYFTDITRSAMITFDYEFLTVGILRIKLFVFKEESFDIVIDGVSNEVRMERFRSKNRIEIKDNHFDYIRTCKLSSKDQHNVSILIDVSSIELFIDKGEIAMTSLFFPVSEENQCVLETDTIVRVKDMTVSKLSF